MCCFDEFTVSHKRIGYPGKPDDIDADGLSNEWETTYFGTDSSADPSVDSDADGEINYREYVAGTSPQDAEDELKPIMGHSGGSAFSMDFEGKAGRPYRLMRTFDMVDTSWVMVDETSTLPTDGEQTLQGSATFDKAFYRIEVIYP